MVVAHEVGVKQPNPHPGADTGVGQIESGKMIPRSMKIKEIHDGAIMNTVHDITERPTGYEADPGLHEAGFPLPQPP